MRISIRELKDYLRCPLLYKLKYIDELPGNVSIDEYFKDYFKLSLYFYYFSILEKKEKSFDKMMKKWGELWFSREMTELFPEDLLKEKSNEAVVIMNSFFKKYGSERVTPIAVNFSYEVIFTGVENIHVTGEIDLIKILNDRTNRSETDLCTFSLSNKYPDDFMVKHDLSLSLASYAFRNSFKSKEDKIIINNIKNAEDTFTFRSGNDFVRTEKTVRNISVAINHGVFYPNPNPISCSNCSYRMFCLNERSINTGGVLNGNS